MSATTLELEISVQREASNAADDVPMRGNARAARAALSSRTAESMLWGFDEQVARAHFDRIQARLIRLEAALFEEFDTRIDAQSRDALLCLFVACPSVRPPSISAQPDGVLMATWRRAGGEDLVVKCVSRSKIHFAVVSRSLANANLLDRQWGTYHSPSLFFQQTPVARRIAE